MLVGHKLHTSPLHSLTFICVAATYLRKNRYHGHLQKGYSKP